MNPAHDDDPAIAAAFLNLYLEDVEAGRARSLADYRAAFPGADALIERQWRALHEPASADANDAKAGDDSPAFGPYRILAELGRGGQGVVHLALDTRLSRRVALKILSRQALGSDAMRLRFRREAEVASRLEHPGICAVYESGAIDGRAFIAMRHVEGETLATRIAAAAETGERPRTREDIAEVIELFERIAMALDAAHEAGIVHRDVKPGNVMVTSAGDPVLLDFGLARDEESDAGLTATGDVFGTPAYMSPEQISGAPVDRRTDVYSLAATLQECLTLERPFRAPTREALYQAILTSDPADPTADAPELPRDLVVVLATALERDLDRRYQSAAGLAAELRRVREHQPILARPAGRLLRAWRFCQRNPALATTTLFAFALLVLALVATMLLLDASEANRAGALAMVEQQKRHAAELQRSLDDARAGRLSKQEERVRASIEEGFQTFFAGNWRPARDSFVEALREDPGNASALAGLFWYELYDGGDPLAVVDEHGGRHPALARWMRGLVLEQRGEHEEAQRHFAESASGSSDVRAYLEALRAVDNFQPSAGAGAAAAALPHFRRAIALARRPEFHYWHGLMMAADRAGDRATVDDAAEALIHHWPESPSTWEAVAQFYGASDPDRALDALQRILAIEESAMARIGLSQHALRRGEVETARTELERAVAADPELDAAWFMLGSFLLGQGDPGGAVEPLMRAIRLEPRHAAYPLGLLRQAFEALGDERARLSDDALVRLARTAE